MKPYKSLGPGGLHAGFYQRFWLTVGDSVIKEVIKVFLDRKVPDYLNKTLTVLIPKVQGPEYIGNYRPISLCNSVYKNISKVIVNRLRPLLENIVSPFQSAFILGKRGTDNVIIVQELVHTIGHAKGRKGYMAIKIDLEKAYDRIEWNFIREMFLKFNFPIKLTDLIMSCVSSVSTSLLINGGCLDSFCPSRGIKQGDPLSPYLFILCIEYLGHLIEEKCAAKVWNPLKTSRNGPLFLICSLQMTWFYLLRWTRKIVLLSMKLFRSFMLNLVRKLAKPNHVFSSRLMWTLTKEIFCLTLLVLALLTTSASIWASL